MTCLDCACPQLAQIVLFKDCFVSPRVLIGSRAAAASAKRASATHECGDSRFVSRGLLCANWHLLLLVGKHMPTVLIPCVSAVIAHSLSVETASGRSATCLPAACLAHNCIFAECSAELIA